VDSIWLYRTDQPERLRLLPTATAQLVIDLSGDGLPLPYHGPDPVSTGRSRATRGAYAALLHGVDSTAYSLENNGPVYEFGVDFKSGGLYPFFAPPANELHNMHVSLDALWGTQEVRELCERVAEADTLEARARILEELFVRQLVRPLDHHPAVTAALRAISLPSPSGRHADAQRARIAWVAEAAGLSRGRLTRLFQQEVGLTPKHYACVRRFLRVVQATRPQPTQQRVNWARLAVECGYYDQAHLIKEFQAFAGVSPNAYLRARAADSLYSLPQAD